jgi:pSer/pThr/pTyr-binding forkhead associated (FHA) protein
MGVPIEATKTMPMVPVQGTPEAERPRPAQAPVALPIGIALLVVHHGPNAGARFLLDRDTIVAGRHPEADIFLDDVTVSRQHAEFRRSGTTFTVVDAGSLNGTYVNRQRTDSAELRSGDEVQIGKFRLTFLIADART